MIYVTHPLLGKAYDWVTPVRTGGATGKIGSFGLTRVNTDGTPKQHNGVDLLAIEGWPVFAAHAGTVEKAGWQNAEDHAEGFGQRIRILGRERTLRTAYAHLQEVLVEEGESVFAGTMIGKVGRTGNVGDILIPTHLHFEVHLLRGTLWVAKDPMVWAPQGETGIIPITGEERA